jgi:hypothetical protein
MSVASATRTPRNLPISSCAHSVLLDQTAITVLLRRACTASEFGFQMPALDPAYYSKRIDPSACARLEAE